MTAEELQEAFLNGRPVVHKDFLKTVRYARVVGTYVRNVNGEDKVFAICADYNGNSVTHLDPERLEYDTQG